MSLGLEQTVRCWAASFADDVADQGEATTASTQDTDGDGVPDDVELRLGTNPHKKDSDGDGTPDGQEDPDRDGLTTLFELRRIAYRPG